MSRYTLSVFMDELPDPDLELYSQVPVVRSLFRFWSLSPDMRKRIWDLVRARRVLATMDHSGVLHTKTPPPITFCICVESRVSTLPHYNVPMYLRGSRSMSGIQVKPPTSAFHLHFFDPDVDTLILHGRNPSDSSCFFHLSTGSYSEDLAEVKFLEVKRFDWAMLMFRGWNAWSLSGNPEFTYFRCFRGLKELVVLGGGHGLQTKQEQEECKTALTRVFQNFNARYPEYKIPEIVVNMV